ncbi:MAG: gfo/Idh/MocA family oxidoreductase [Nitrospiraceae bacterium]|nr:MAG: gfo/Idh/MocA family oxidoreductase [Nitrospiraceae bacterium]
MKVLVTGCGSIGRRHISNLIASDRIEKVFVYSGNKDCLKDLNDRGKAVTVTSLSSIGADFAVIANDTSRHVETALELAEDGMDLFIEKPLSHNLDMVDALHEKCRKKGTRIFIGYNLRFLSIMDCIKDNLAGKLLGDLYFAKIEVGQYLPLWRKGTDYRQSYSASSARGGGVALDLSHELDYMRLFFGDPVSWKVMRSRAGSLEMDAEDLFEGLYLYENNFICNVHMDCLQEKPKRSLRIEGSKGSLLCDFIGKELTVSSGKDKTVINDPDLFDITGTYKKELDHFMDVVEKGTKPAVDLQDGIAILKLIEDR